MKFIKMPIFYFSFIGAIIFLNSCTNYEQPDDIKIPKYHTEKNVGIWINQVSDHIPVIKKLDGRKIEVTIPFTPTFKPRHYIEVIALMQGEKTQIKAFKYKPSLQKPIAVFEIPSDKGNYWILAKCNLHNMWRVEVEPINK